MTIICEKFTVHTKGNTDIVDVTNEVKNLVYRHSLKDAVVFVYVAGSTVSITNKVSMNPIKFAFEKIIKMGNSAPKNNLYKKIIG